MECKNDGDAPSSTCGSEGPCQQDRSSSFAGPKNSKPALLFFFRKICTHTKFSWDPLFALRRSDFTLSRIRRSSVGLSNPRNPKTVNADLSSSSSGFSLIVILAVAVSRSFSQRFPKPDFLKFQRAHKIGLSTPLHSIGTSDFAISQILMQRFRDFTPRNPETIN
jgi:hypothetical protein